MQNGVCPRCDASEVYASDAQGPQSGLSAGDGQPLLRIYKDGRWIPDITLLPMAHYVCRACGHVEMRVLDVAALEKLDDSTNWKRLDGAS